MIRLTYNRTLILLLSAACCCLAGCGETKKGQLPTAQAAGQVTYRGKPLVRGEIKFLPVQTPGKEARAAQGTLDEQGRYCLSTYAQDDGAVLGDYQVVVESREAPPEDVTAARRMTNRGMAVLQPKSLIPMRYFDSRTSGLSAHVVSGKNTLNFDLKD
jgi:hypothetical protein